MRLRCEAAIPAGFVRGRVLVRLRQPEPDLLLLLPARGLDDATHQVTGAAGLPLLSHLSERDPVVSGELARNGRWEFAESAALLWLARPGMTFVDAGACLGYYSALLARVLGASGLAEAFEPEPRNHLVLTANALLTARLCPDAAPIRPHRHALSDRAGSARLHLFEGNLGLHSLAHGQRASGAIDVQAATIDALRFPTEGEPAIGRHIDLVKADVQGSEPALLRGAVRTLAEDRPVLCLECEPYLSGADACVGMIDWLAGRGYSAFRLFHSDEYDPHRVLAEAARVLSAAQASEMVRRDLVGPYGTLLAFPDRRSDRP
jgi:FkbM family methyltransferase